MAGRPGTTMRAIDLVHRWTGGFVGLLLALLGGTGLFLLHQTTILRLTLRHAADPVVRDDAQLAAVVSGLLDDPKVRGIRLAGEKLGVHQVYRAGETAGAYVDQAGGVVTQWSSMWQRPEIWIYDLHRHLLLGPTGMTIIGIAALAGIGFVVTGSLLWWQTRSTFSFRLLPKQLSRPAIVRHHRDLGIVVAPLLLLTFASGTMMALKPVEALVLAPFGGAKKPHAAKTEAPSAAKRASARQIDWGAIIATARAHYPEGELRWIAPPSKKEPRILVRMRLLGEWNPNGRTMLWFGTDGTLAETRNAFTAPRGDRIRNAEYPLHTGDALPWLGRWIMTLSGLALLMLGTLAMWTFWFRRPRPARRPARPAIPSPSAA